jgi:4-carboxymuconolactone decarboxylase
LKVPEIGQTDGVSNSQERMPAIAAAQMTDAQREAAAEITDGPRGGVVGPFAAALRSPECMRRLQHFGAYLRYDSSIPPRLREIAILLTAYRWRQDYEWVTHEPLARAAGVAPATIDAIRAGTVPPSLPDDEAMVFELCAVLFADARVPDPLYARALDVLGESGLVDLVCAAGYYSTLAMIMNVAQTALPAGSSRPLT